MDNYEINILRRDGNWKKVTQSDLLYDAITSDEKTENVPKQDVFLDYLNKISSIINKLDALEDEKNKLKDSLKIYEEKFLTKKKNTEETINIMTKEAEMLEKTINVIKNLKNF